jgi:hypothetical protein
LVSLMRTTKYQEYHSIARIYTRQVLSEYRADMLLLFSAVRMSEIVYWRVRNGSVDFLQNELTAPKNLRSLCTIPLHEEASSGNNFKVR